MNFAKLLLTPLIAVVLVTPVAAQNTSGAAATPPKEKKICRREAVTGSMFPKSTCHTAAEWVRVDQQNSQNAEAMRNRQSGVAR